MRSARRCDLGGGVGMSMTPERNHFQGAATETDPPEATFDLEPTLAGYPPGLVSLCSALALVAWLTAPAVVWIVGRAAL
jgi:hypothetical protein